jgi:hypothetical protein
MSVQQLRRRSVDRSGQIALLVGLCLFAVWAGFNLNTFAWDGDEGMNLMRTQMWRAGYDLYTDVWSDQPPGMMILIRLAFAAFGTSVQAGRAVTITLAVLGLLAVALIAHEAAGWSAAFSSVVLLATAPLFLRLSRAVMSSLPATCLATLSFALVLIYCRRAQRRWLLISGLAFGMSLLIKPLGVPVLAPIGLALLLLPAREQIAAQATVSDFVLWGLGAVIPVVVSLGVFDGREMVAQIVGTTTNAQSAYTLTVATRLRRIADVLRQGHLGLVALGLYGVAVATWHRSPIALLLLIWLLVAVLAFAVYTPVWYHHAFLILIPLAIAAGIGLSWLADAFGLRRAYMVPDDNPGPLRRRLRFPTVDVALAMIAVVAWLIFLPQTVREIRGSVRWSQPEAWTGLADLRALTQPGDYVITDYPIMAFRAHLLVPPGLATPSSKRLASGELSAHELQTFAERFQPTAVVIWSKVFRYNAPEFVAWVDDHYYPAHIYNVEQRIYVDLPDTPDHVLEAELGERVTLVGYTVPSEVKPGERLSVTLFWRAERPLDTSYTVFNHLLDDSGQLRAQADGLPIGGRHPTTAWQPGKVVTDLHEIDIPPDLPAGRYLLQVGMYDLATLDRLPLTTRPDQDAIRLQPVQVAP